MRYATVSAIAIAAGSIVWAAVRTVEIVEDALEAAVVEITRRPS